MDGNSKENNLAHEFDSIPLELKNLTQWVLWKKEKMKDRITKVPYQANGKKASTTNKNTWTSFEKAVQSCKNGFNGIGFVFTKDDPYIGIDFDHVDKLSEFDKSCVNLWINQFKSYTEKSQSGNGYHIIIRGKLPFSGKKKSNYEIYRESRYFCMTGNLFNDNKITENQQVLNQFLHTYFPSSNKKTNKKEVEKAIAKSDSKLNDQEIFDKINNSKQQEKFHNLWTNQTGSNYPSDSEKDLALASIVAFYTQDVEKIKKIMRSSHLNREKWERDDYLERTIEKAIAGLTATYGSIKGKDFWLIYPNFKGEILCSIVQKKLVDFLESNGFSKLYYNDSIDSFFISIKNNICEKTSIEKIRDFTYNYIKKVKIRDSNTFNLKSAEIREMVLETFSRGADHYFSQKKLQLMEATKLDFKRDTKDESFIYYKNGFLSVTKNEINLRNYNELDSLIWRDQILERDFIQDEKDEKESVFEMFLKNVTDFEKDEKRYKTMKSSIGYLLHQWKNPSLTKAICFFDEKIDDVPQGRSGKSLIGNALGYIRKLTVIDGKHFKGDERFAFQNVELDTQVLEFDDVTKFFDIENLFHKIASGFEVEKKGEHRLKIPFEDSPKILITSNYTLKGEGNSHIARRHEIELSSHYDADFTPVDDFNHNFFYDWNIEEWARFDFFMGDCMKCFLENGLLSYIHINLDHRKLIDSTNPEFIEFMDAFFQDENVFENSYTKDEFFQDENTLVHSCTKDEFLEQLFYFSSDIENLVKKGKLTKNKITIWTKKYCKFNEINFTEIVKRTKSGIDPTTAFKTESKAIRIITFERKKQK